MKPLWIARDIEGRLELYADKPREDMGLWFNIHGRIGQLPKGWFPEVTVNNSPLEVELKLIKE